MLLAIAYVFRQIISSNLDLFYIIGGLLLIKNSNKNLRIFIRIFIWIYIILMYSLIQSLFLGVHFIPIRFCISIIKFTINIYLMYYVYFYAKDINFSKVAKYTGLIYFLCLVIAVFLKNDILWRFNDEINKFSTTRLKLFYSEPSELGFAVGILVIFYILKWYKNKTIEIKEKIILIILIVIMFLAMPYAAIFITIVSLIPIGLNIILKVNKKSLIILMFIFSFVIGFVSFNFNSISNNSLYKRTIAILEGKDASTSYRVGVGNNVMKSVFKDTDALGVGLSNVNTKEFKQKYIRLGMVDVIANSFMYTIIELGILGIAIIVLLFLKCLKNVINTKSIVKLTYLIYIFSYQIPGGYFTNPLNWIIYGILLSDISDLKFLN